MGSRSRAPMPNIIIVRNDGTTRSIHCMETAVTNSASVVSTDFGAR